MWNILQNKGTCFTQMTSQQNLAIRQVLYWGESPTGTVVVNKALPSYDYNDSEAAFILSVHTHCILETQT